MVSGLNQINCSDPTVSSNSRYGCPRSSLYYRYYDPNCLSPACSATQGVPSIPSSMENWQIFCISQVQVLDQMFPNCTSQQNALVACKQNTSNSCTAQQNAYDACYTSHPSICSNDQSCSEGTVYQLPLSPQFPSNSQDYNCDLDYIRQGNLYSVEFDFYFNGIYFGQTVFEIGSDNLTAAFHQNGNEFLGDVFYLEHNLNTQLRVNFLFFFSMF